MGRPMNEVPVPFTAFYDKLVTSADRESLISELVLRAGSKVQIGFFTNQGTPISMHYIAGEGFLRCLVDGCPACEYIGKPSAFYCLPVYDILRDCVAVLKVSTSTKPHALLPKLRGFFNSSIDVDHQIYLEIERIDNFRYRVTEFPWRDPLLGASAITQYCKTVEQGGSPVDDLYPISTIEDFDCLDGIANLKKAGRIKV